MATIAGEDNISTNLNLAIAAFDCRFAGIDTINDRKIYAAVIVNNTINSSRSESITVSKSLHNQNFNSLP